MKTFGFTLTKKGEKLFDEKTLKKFNKETRERVRNSLTEQYRVDLPHSCDEWVITETPDKEEAVRDLTDFINEAQLILMELKK